MSNAQNINAWFDGFDRDFKAIAPNIIAETATEFFKDTFRTQSWDGVPWPALSPNYAAKKRRGAGRILVSRGFLLNSIRPSTVTSSRIVITGGNTRTPYARAHNEGLRIQGVQNISSYTNRNFMGKGKRVQIPAHQRRVNFKMPRRQFMGPSPLLNTAIRNRLNAAFNARP